MLQVGVDCENISRFRRLPYEKNQTFYQRLFTDNEIKYCLSCREPYPRFAARFAAKEAAIKALNGIAKPHYKDIEIKKRFNSPILSITRKSIKNKIRNFTFALSITHSQTQAIAFLIIGNDVKIVSKAKNLLKSELKSTKKIIST